MAARTRKFGKAVLEMSLNDKVTKGLKDLQSRISGIGSQINSIGKGFAAVGASILGPLVGAVATFSSVGDSLNKMSARTGFSAQALSELDHAAQASGTSLETVEKGIRGMSKVLLTAQQGSKGAIEKLAELGLTVDDLAGKTPEKQFEKMAAAVSSIEDPSRRAAAAMAVFGKAGSDMLPLFANGVSGMNALRQEAVDLGITLSDEDAAAAAELTDALGRLQEQFKAIITRIGAAVAGPLTDFADKLKGNLSEIISWIRANGELIVTIGKIGATLAAVGGVVVSFGGVFQVAAVAIGGVTTALTFLLAHPVVAGIAAITVGVIALANEFRKATSTATGFDDALNKLSRARTYGDPDELSALSKRFEQLAAKTKLTKKEQEEARKVIIALRQEYGDLASFVDRSTGAIVEADKTRAQLNAARGGRSSLVLQHQIGFAERGLEVAAVKGASDQDLEDRRAALAKLREELARTQRIIADAKPITQSALGGLPTVPPVEEIAKTGREGGGEFAKAFLDGARSGFGEVSDLITESIEAGTSAIERIRESLEGLLDEDAIKDGLKEATVAADSGKSGPLLDTRFIEQQIGNNNSEVRAMGGISDGVSKTNSLLDKLLRLLTRDGGIPVE